MKRRIIAGLLAAVMVLMAVPVSAGSAASGRSAGSIDRSKLDEISRMLYGQSDDPFDYTDKGMKLQAENEDRPKAFDLRDVDGHCYVTPIKDQAPFGTCWGFAAIGAAETSILGNEELNNDGHGGELYSTSQTQKGSTDGKDADGKEILNLSEKHLAYFVITALDDPDSPQNGEGTYLINGNTVSDGLNNGGFSLLATNSFATGIGPNLESRDKVLEYHGASRKDGELDYDHPTAEYGWVNGKKTKINYSDEDYWALDENWRFKQSYVLKGSNMMPAPAGTDDKGEYRYNEAATSAIKDQLMQKRGVQIGFSCLPMVYDVEGPSRVLNLDNFSYYNKYQNRANHAVLIVGWDDNYPAENFAETPKDENGNPVNGAWLVKNSWGSEEEVFPNRREGDYGLFEGQDKPPYKKTSEVNTGYFWLSYYDKSIDTPESLEFDRSNVGTSYIIDQHDFMPVYMMGGAKSEKVMKMANVFKAEYPEVLEGISFHSSVPGADVEYAVYVLPQRADGPEDGLLVASGHQTYEFGGFKKIDIDDVQIAKGQSYSIVITEKMPDGGYTINMPVGMSREEATEWDTTYQKGIINKNESYVFLDNDWYDYSDEELRNTIRGDEEWKSFDNFPIKGYCRESAEKIDLTFDISIESSISLMCTYPGTNHDLEYRLKLRGTDVLPDETEPEWYLSSGAEELVDLEVSAENPDRAVIKARKAGKGCLCVHIDGVGTGVVTFVVNDLHLTAPYTTDGDYFEYTGEPLMPEARSTAIEDSEDVIENGKDYEIIYENNVKCGKAIMKVNPIGDHKDLIVVSPENGSFIIYPAKAKVAKLTAGKRSLKVKAKDQKASGLTGYQISYKVKGTSKWKSVDSAKNIKTIKKLKKGKKYNVRVRGYVKVDGEKHYGSWSAVKTSGKIK